MPYFYDCVFFGINNKVFTNCHNQLTITFEKAPKQIICKGIQATMVLPVMQLEHVSRFKKLIFAIEEVSQNFGVGEIFGHVRGEMLNNSQRGDICMQVGGAGLFLTTWLS